MEKIILKVNGMSCGHCEAAVAGALANLTGVKEARADRESGAANVEYDPETVSVDEMKKAIAAAGYVTE